MLRDAKEAWDRVSENKVYPFVEAPADPADERTGNAAILAILSVVALITGLLIGLFAASWEIVLWGVGICLGLQAIGYLVAPKSKRRHS